MIYLSGGCLEKKREVAGGQADGPLGAPAIAR